MSTFFISGHLDLTHEEFTQHYEPALGAAVERGDAFVVGDAPGADTMAQAWLEGRVARERVTVFHMFVAPRSNVGGCPTRGGFTSDKTRDEAMTGASDGDIAWVRPGREKSGTAKNLKRRRKDA